MIRLKREEKQIYEYACHEGNIAMKGILAGARAKEKASVCFSNDPTAAGR